MAEEQCCYIILAIRQKAEFETKTFAILRGSSGNCIAEVNNLLAGYIGIE